MPLTELRTEFLRLKALRRVEPELALQRLGVFGRDALALLKERAVLRPFEWKGRGPKSYRVAVLPGKPTLFSRALNADLLIDEPDDFERRWSDALRAVQQSAGTCELAGVGTHELNSLLYSAVVGYAAAVDLFNPGDRGGPGTYFEMVIGPLLSILTGRSEGGAISIPIFETGETESVPVDLSFAADGSSIVLVVPTKISTRERISQAYVHQRILDTAGAQHGRTYRSVLAIANENNTMFARDTPAVRRTWDVGWTQETLVPGTIVLYHKYVAELSGLYYLDPPTRYVKDPPAVFPVVRTLGDLFATDLPGLLRVE